jgi:hypothetical protein
MADRYLTHLRERTFPALTAIAGHRGAYVLRRDGRSGVEFTVITLWDSIAAIRSFAGPDAEAAVVPPEALALLDTHDERAVHWDVALDNSATRGAK